MQLLADIVVPAVIGTDNNSTALSGSALDNKAVIISLGAEVTPTDSPYVVGIL